MNLEDLNETDVREEIIAPLIRKLGYRSGTLHNVLREQSLRYPRIFLGRKDYNKDPPLRGKADYILEAGGSVRWVIEAKSPTCEIGTDEIEQAWSYANHPEVRAVYFVLCNGKRILIFQTNRAPSAPALLEIAYEELEEQTKQEIVFNILSPNAVLRDHPPSEIDTKPPLGPGLRSFIRITGGYIRYDKSSFQMPALTEFQATIIGGAVERDSEGRMVAFLELSGPSRSLQEFTERLGLSKFEMLSNDFSFSSSPERPTTFTYAHSVIFPEGEELIDINTWKKVKLPFNLPVSVNATATGVLESNQFKGKFVNHSLINGTLPMIFEGHFCLYVA
jgi:hypothetical protein